MNKFYKFFCWCSGARLYLLEKCPSDFNKFFGIGLIILMTGLMAFISGSYAFYAVFSNAWLAAAFGLFWGTLIFFLDWYLVSSLKKENKPQKEILMSIPRIILALFLAIVISKPLELKLFEKEIDSEIASMQQLKNIDYKKNLDQEFYEIEALQEENRKMNIEINNAIEIRNKLFTMTIKEAEGTSGTGKVGRGPVYEEKKMELENSDKQLEELKSRLIPLIEENNIQIADLRNARKNRVNSNQIITENYDGFLARMEAFGVLTDKSKRVNLISTFILILFICIESAPLFVKLISSRGPYDQLLELEEAKILYNTQKEINDIQLVSEQYIMVQNEKQRVKNQAEIEISKEYHASMLDAKVHVNERRINAWKNKEINKVDENFINDELHKSVELLIKEKENKLTSN